jgi:hypothetical protein
MWNLSQVRKADYEQQRRYRHGAHWTAQQRKVFADWERRRDWERRSWFAYLKMRLQRKVYRLLGWRDPDLTRRKIEAMVNLMMVLRSSEYVRADD